jgi:hypothetical protein
MTSKLPSEKNSQIFFKSCFKFVLLTKKFKEKNHHYIIEFFFKCDDYEHKKVHNILDIIELSECTELNKFSHSRFYENVYLNVSYDFLKFYGSSKIKV